MGTADLGVFGGRAEGGNTRVVHEDVDVPAAEHDGLVLAAVGGDRRHGLFTALTVAAQTMTCPSLAARSITEARPVPLVPPVARAVRPIRGSSRLGDRRVVMELVVDHWHLEWLANLMVTQVRQRVTREQFGHRSRKENTGWAYRRLLLRGGRHLSDEQ